VISIFLPNSHVQNQPANPRPLQEEALFDMCVIPVSPVGMVISPDETKPPWLLFGFSLPAKRASQRVEIWRLLKRYGAIGLRSSEYVLPNNPGNLERFEWLAATIRKYRGEASVIHVDSIGSLPPKDLTELFVETRGGDYDAMMRELKRYKTASKPGQLSRLCRRFQDIVAVDFFNGPPRSRVGQLLANADARPQPSVATGRRTSRQKQQFQKRAWMTRPRSGIDRMSSAWLILRSIDPKARFVFGTDPQELPKQWSFDMFQANGFGIAEMTALLRLSAKSFKCPCQRKVGMRSSDTAKELPLTIC